MGSARGVGSWRSWVRFAVIVFVGTGRTVGVTYIGTFIGAYMGAQIRTKVPIWVPKIELRYLFGYLNRGTF
jgi:hypothetical protein